MKYRRRITSRRRREPLYRPMFPSATWTELMKAVADVLYKYHDNKVERLATMYRFTQNEKMFVGVLANIILNLGERNYDNDRKRKD